MYKTNYLSPLILVILFQFIVSCNKEDEAKPKSPVSFSDVKATIVTAKVRLSSLFNTEGVPATEITEVGFLVGNTRGVTVENSVKYKIASGSTITATLEDLLPTTKYYAAPYAIVKGKVVKGDEIDFVTRKPGLSISPKSAGVMQLVTLTGDFEIDENSQVVVLVGDNKATMRKQVSGEISFLVPQGFAPGTEHNITLEIRGVREQTAEKLLINRWSLLSPLPEFLTFGSDLWLTYYLDGEAFIFNGYGKDLFIYHPTNDTWEFHDYEDTAKVNTEAYFTINNKAYMGLGYDHENGVPSKAFYQFRPASRTWVRRKDFPGRGYGEGALHGTYVSTSTKGYVGLGHIGNEPIKEFWEYDPQLDNWTRMPDFPGKPFYSDYSFAIGENVYIGGGAERIFWKFNTITKEWSQISSFPTSFKESVYSNHRTFVKGTKAYIIEGPRIFTYDSSQDLWDLYPETIPSNPQAGANAFYDGTTLFVGGGEGLEVPYLKHFYRIDIE